MTKWLRDVYKRQDLNWYNPDLIEAIFERAKFWLDKGVDGFRIDAPNYFLHDRALRDNPPRPADAPLPDGIPPDNPMVRQLFKYNFCRPETIEIIKQIRKFVDRYPGVFTLGETTLAEDSIALSGEYAFGEDRLHLAYSSALLVDEPISAKLMQRILKKVDRHFTHGGNCWMVGNHDYGRMRSRWTGVDAAGNPYPEEFYHLLAALLVSLPGALCLYQGDELGLPEARIPDDIPVERIKDPFGRALYPNVKGRDGSRTPMPWQKEARNAGFTTAKEPWLPVSYTHLMREEAELLRSVYTQQHDLDTLLADHVLLRLRNVIITPHSAFNTREAVQRIADTTVSNIQAFVKGQPQEVVVG